MELRDIEIFLTLAEELHFGRTAERLNVTPARITQAIKKQERQIGALLFERTNRVVRLTEVGRQLRDDLRPLYQGLEQSVRRAKLTASGQTTQLRVALMPFNYEGLHKYWEEFRRRHPQWGLRLYRLAFTDPFSTLRTGQYDALVIWGPVDEDLTMGPVLFRDSRVLSISKDHPLADRSEVSIEDFADYPHTMPPNAQRDWEETYLPFFTPSGRPITRSQPVTNPDDLIDRIGNGDIVHAFPAHVLYHWGVTHVRWIPVTDMPPLSYALVWRTESEPVRALAQVINDLSNAP
ncbi:LysR family transcriptional regulator [Nocardia sp. SYP-A9097]|uniref:LysR substrate-binding domain-containing protein n=1 Tax=Nocardia sp. SYP-A9097 TaxID=2663237 RepID=UPI00132B3AA1|nr:LysR family transcriptional regulator [Nocardia sp. SYP-A9097]MRH88054.1 LysR family transcriptional regulator [Nocardia sp. SYP-A9097]